MQQVKIGANGPQEAKARVVGHKRIKFKPAPYGGLNTSGYHPIGDFVLVRIDEPEDQTEGGVHLPDDQVERYSMASESGVIIECGAGAFVWNADRTREFVGPKLFPGKHICFERYAGSPKMGYDGNWYRMMPDRCICGEDDLGKFNHG